MTAPWTNHEYPAAPAPGLVPQQGTGMRVTRVVLAGLLIIGWLSEASANGAALAAQTDAVINWDEPALVSLVILILLIAGPQPRWATKWAWFWLLAIGPMSAVFLLLEPVPVWQSEPAYQRPSRLTGGWAFLISMFGGAILVALAAMLAAPWLAAWSWLSVGNPAPFGG